MVFKFRQIMCVYYEYLLNSNHGWYVMGECVTTSFFVLNNSL